MQVKWTDMATACGFFAKDQFQGRPAFRASLTHSFLTAKQLFPGFFKFFYAIFKLLRPEHDCYANFDILLYIKKQYNNILKNKISIKH